MTSRYLDEIHGHIDDPVLNRIRELAENNKVPIISDEGLRLILQLIRLGNKKRVLEIGTAIGYTTYALASFSEANVTTLEIDPEVQKHAISMIPEGLAKAKIRFILGDALTIDETELGSFDLIFLDAGKSQYIRLFDKYSPLLETGGIIITDNLLFRGFVENPETIISRNRRQLVSKIDRFNKWLLKKDDFDSSIYSLGDGMAISIKK